MAVNSDKHAQWPADVEASVAMYNSWYMDFAPNTYRETRSQTTETVRHALEITANLMNVNAAMLRANPALIQTLRMTTCPPIARDRLVGLAGVTKNLVYKMESGEIPPQMKAKKLAEDLDKIGDIIEKMADRELFPWLANGTAPTEDQLSKASYIVAERLCSAVADPIIRNEQEKRQLSAIGAWLDARRYHQIDTGAGITYDHMQPGTYSFRMSVPGEQEDGSSVNIPTDAVIMPLNPVPADMPLLVEAKSAGDFTNVNKRRKEEATKIQQLRKRHGDDVRFILFLCGYFDKKYLQFEAAAGIDWVWEHRIDDLTGFDL